MQDTTERRSRKSVAFTDEQLVVDADGSVSVMSAPEDPKDSAQSHTSRTPPSADDVALGQSTNTSKADPTTEAPPADDGLDLSLMKKKKKKKKVEDADGEGDGTPAEDGGLDLSMKKKKKKKVKDAGADDDEFTAKLKQLEVKDEDEDAQVEEVEAGDMDAGTGTWAHDETKSISYSPLLERFFSHLSQKNPDHALSGTRSYKIPPPQCMREGNRKTVFANLADICKRMKRTDEHVTAYLFAELGTNGSTDGSRRLVIKGRFQQKQIENVVRKYISESILHNYYCMQRLTPSSRVRYLQDLQIPRHRAQQGREPSVLRHMQQLRLAPFGAGHQDWFLCPGRQAEKDAGLSYSRLFWVLRSLRNDIWL